MRIRSKVLEHDGADPGRASAHFADRLAFETDCSDVAADIVAGVARFIVVDCRSPALFAVRHIPGAINMPHARITAESVAQRIGDTGTLIVTYCNGPHCNASTRGALRFAELGRVVKEMPGGMDGWLREGFPTETGTVTPAAR